ncbi:MAG: DUF4348 domain-containing protein [Prevotella sp.]|nr:DUF4348 domain-containing protein [Prevotella sp.]
MKRILGAVGVCAILMFSCTGQRGGTTMEVPADSVADTTEMTAIDSMVQLIIETPMPKAADELFDDFLFNFAANSKLQRERVVFPLQVKHLDGKTELLEKRRWKSEYFFMKQGYYTLLFDNDEQMALVKDTSVSEAVVEKIFLKKSMVKDYHFRRIRGAWMLLAVNEQPLEGNVNASFLTFYKQFSESMEVQKKSLNSTVTFVGPDPDDDFSVMEGLITADTWEAFAPKLPQKMIYNIVYGRLTPTDEQKIFILRGISNGMELELRFKNSEKGWRLMKMTT